MGSLVAASETLVPRPGMEPGPTVEHGALTLGLAGKSRALRSAVRSPRPPPLRHSPALCPDPQCESSPHTLSALGHVPSHLEASTSFSVSHPHSCASESLLAFALNLPLLSVLSFHPQIFQSCLASQLPSLCLCQISAAGTRALTRSSSVSSLCDCSCLTLLLEGLVVGKRVLLVGLAVDRADRYRLVVGAPGQGRSCQPFCVHLSPQGQPRASCNPVNVAACVLITSPYYSFPSPWALSKSLRCLWFPNCHFWLDDSSFLS